MLHDMFKARGANIWKREFPVAFPVEIWASNSLFINMLHGIVARIEGRCLVAVYVTSHFRMLLTYLILCKLCCKLDDCSITTMQRLFTYGIDGPRTNISHPSNTSDELHYAWHILKKKPQWITAYTNIPSRVTILNYEVFNEKTRRYLTRCLLNGIPYILVEDTLTYLHPQ